MINVLKAIKTINKIEQLQKELHTFSLAFLALQDVGLMPETEKRKGEGSNYARCKPHDQGHFRRQVSR